MIYERPPDNFKSKFDIVSCFIECEGEILLLHRQNHKPQGDTWGVPAGKVHTGETFPETMVRELSEETGITASAENLKYFGKVFVRYPEYDFMYHTFHLSLNKKPEVTIHADEHKDFAWVTPQKALAMNLMLDEDTCIKSFFKILQ